MKKKYKLVSDKNIEIRKKMKFFIILNDEIYWVKINNICTPYMISRLREYRKKFILPRPRFFNKFVEDFKIIEKDERDSQTIILDLLSFS
jgi:hypothetical protein